MKKYFIVGLITVVLMACKKSGSTAANCNIVGMYDSNRTIIENGNPAVRHVYFTYDSTGRLDSISSPPFYKAFYYFSNLNVYVIRDFSGTDIITYTDSIFLNSGGQPAEMRKYYSDHTHPQTHIFNYQYSYDATGQIQRVIFTTIDGSQPNDTSFFTWTNGDVTAIDDGNYHGRYSFSSLKNKKGDYIQMDALTYFWISSTGELYRTNSHLINVADLDNLKYTFNDNGDIATITWQRSASIDRFVSYQYSCK